MVSYGKPKLQFCNNLCVLRSRIEKNLTYTCCVTLATRQATYVGDIRVAGRGCVPTTQACCQMKSEMNYLGNQASDAKYRQPSNTSGAWKGEIIHTDTPFPMKSTTGKKWAKFKDGLQLVLTKSKDSGFIETSTLQQVVGLGVHITEVYPYGRCYLKGFSIIEAFRDGRDLDGWRLANAMTRVQLLEINHSSDLQVREG